MYLTKAQFIREVGGPKNLIGIAGRNISNFWVLSYKCLKKINIYLSFVQIYLLDSDEWTSRYDS